MTDAAARVQGGVMDEPTRMPAVYLGHGAPPLVDDELWVSQLQTWAKDLPKPKQILVVSAHWESAPLTVGRHRREDAADLRLLRVPAALLRHDLLVAGRAGARRVGARR